MNLRQLRYFTGVVDAGNMTRAADRLNVAQTALGAQIKGLEEELGAVLLVRHSRGVAATRAGSLLYDRAKEILQLVDDAQREVRSCLGSEKQQVRFGLTPALMLIAGADIALLVRDQVPALDLGIIEAMSHVLIDSLLRKELDFILCYDVPDRPQLLRTALLQDDLVLVSKASHPAITEPGIPITLAEAVRLPLAMPESGDSIRTTATLAARELGLDLNINQEVRSVTAMKALARRGVASCILPYFSVLDEVRMGALEARPITQPCLRRTLFLASRADAKPLAQETCLAGAVQLSLLGLLEALGPLAQPLWTSERGNSARSSH